MWWVEFTHINIFLNILIGGIFLFMPITATMYNLLNNNDWLFYNGEKHSYAISYNQVSSYNSYMHPNAIVIIMQD